MTSTAATSEISLETVAELAAQLRVDSIRSSTGADSGNAASSMSAADLLAVLVTRHLRYDWDDPRSASNDHLIYSQRHASPLLHSVFKAVGVASDEKLMAGYRRLEQRLQAHPTPVLPWVDVPTGSLDQGLPAGVGVALGGRRLDRQPYRVWVLCGNREVAEGPIWQALDTASYYQLPNLIAIIDVNWLGQRDRTELGWTLDAYASRASAFGVRVLAINGHDLAAIDDALTQAEEGAEDGGGQPTVILARTIIGRGFSQFENSPDWHGRPFPADMADRAVAELGGVRTLVVRGPRPAPSTAANGAAQRRQAMGNGPGTPAPPCSAPCSPLRRSTREDRAGTCDSVLQAKDDHDFRAQVLEPKTTPRPPG
jgi:transketolase